jgi:hypothetical protein
LLVLVTSLSFACGKSETKDFGDSEKLVAYAKTVIEKVEADVKSGNLKDAAVDGGGLPDHHQLDAADHGLASKARIVCEYDRVLAGAKEDMAKLEQMRKDKPNARAGIECNELNVSAHTESLRETVAALKRRNIPLEADAEALADLDKRYTVACPPG